MKKKILITGMIIAVLFIVIALILWQKGIWIPNASEAKKYEVKGIDVSEYQGEIDWKTLAKNIDFAFIKVSEGSSGTDSYFVENFQKASQTDLVLGAYHFFSYESDGVSQANHYINLLESFEDIDNPIIPIVDVELYGENEKNLPDTEEVQKQLKAFLSTIEEKYDTRPVIYATQKSYDLYIKDELKAYDLWIRNVITKPKLLEEKSWTFWQYTNKGKLDGYQGKEEFVDFNVFNGTRTQFYEKVKEKKIQKNLNILAIVQGNITKIEKNVIYLNNNQKEYEIELKEFSTIENVRTGNKMEISELKPDDEIYIRNVKESLGKLMIEEDTTIQVTRNLKGEELKQETLSQKEIAVTIEKIEMENQNTITIIGQMTAFCNSEEYETFEVQILVDENTTIFARTENKIEELQKMQERGDTLYIKLREEDKKKGKLVAENIEVMGC